MLCKIDDDSSLSIDQKSETFHTIAMKVMLLVKRARLDLEPGFVFLPSRARVLTDKDWSKSSKLMSFMLGTKDEVLTLSVYESTNLHM